MCVPSHVSTCKALKRFTIVFENSTAAYFVYTTVVLGPPCLKRCVRTSALIGQSSSVCQRMARVSAPRIGLLCARLQWTSCPKQHCLTQWFSLSRDTSPILLPLPSHRTCLAQNPNRDTQDLERCLGRE